MGRQKPMASHHPFRRLEHVPESLTDLVLAAGRRVLLFGGPGTGKSTLAVNLARALAGAGRPAACIGADPGSPSFGVPGAVCLGVWDGARWRLDAAEAVASLDAGRFRLPLVSSLRLLVERAPEGPLLVDAPGVVRGVAGAELLTGLVEAAAIDVVLALTQGGGPPPFAGELAALATDVCVVPADPRARRPGKRARARERTRLWNTYLQHAPERCLELGALPLLGAPPPADVIEAWPGRQVAMLDATLGTLGLGEVTRVEGGRVWVKTPAQAEAAKSLLVRDARRDARGSLGTEARRDTASVRYAPPPDMMTPPAAGAGTGPRPVARVGPAVATLVNGVFGDPLLHLRLRHQKRSLLFDLGEAGRLPARIAHQVTDVFVSHAHFDHVAGFLWLLRSRIADLPACRVFGPPGLGDNIEGMVRGIRWDRVGDRGPRFEVSELHDEGLRRFRVQAGRRGPEPLDDRPAPDGLLVDEPGFRVLAVTLDHGTPVLAFAFVASRKLNVRKERLTASGLSPGPWLTELKRRLLRGEHAALIELPDGRRERADVLGRELVLESPGEKLAYATDLADTPANRERLARLAQGAHTFFCESVFLQRDAEQAARTGHLTTRGCAEIANAAGAARLVPFHFSRRYGDEPEQVYDEVAQLCSRTLVPSSLELG